MDSSALDSPYVGLAPYESAHSDYFFGRMLDSTVLADNVLARSITVFYGASGVGKSSVLNVGLPKALRAMGVAPRIVSRREWHEPKTAALWLESALAPDAATDTQPFILVLDQFEEFFLYPDAHQIRSFARTLGAIIARKDIEAHLVFSMRDDGLHRLDMLRLHLPALLDTTLELRHLDKSSVREAIVNPVEVWNQRHQRHVSMDDTFADALISELLPRDKSGQLIEGGRLELAYLQLALERIWEAEGGAQATALHTHTLTTKLKGIGEISRRHVEGVLGKVSDDDRAICATVFDRLVTRSGGKILYPAADLAAVAEVPEDRMNGILATLASGRNRLLRAVELPGGGGSRGYEILHDILARPILDWTERYQAHAEAAEMERNVREQRSREQDRRYSRLAVSSAILTGFLALCAGAFGVWGWNESKKADRAREGAIEQRKNAENQLEVANKATGAGIWANLDFTTAGGFTPSEVNALWLLATATPTMRTAFIDAMYSDPALLVRFGRSPGSIARALGLTWPTPGEAQRLLDALLATIKSTTHPAPLGQLIYAIGFLRTKLEPEQTQQVLDAIVRTMPSRSSGSSGPEEAKPPADVGNKADTRRGAEPPLQRGPLSVRNVGPSLQSESQARSTLESARAIQEIFENLTPPQTRIALEHLLAGLRGNGPTPLAASLQGSVSAANLPDDQVRAILGAVLKGYRTGSPIVATTELTGTLAEGDLSDAKARSLIEGILTARGLPVDIWNPGIASAEDEQAARMLVGKLSDAQAHAGLKQILQSLAGNRFPTFDASLDVTMRTLADRVTKEQAEAAFDVAFQAMKQSRSDRYLLALRALPVRALAGHASPTQATAALAYVMKAYANPPSDPRELAALAGLVNALPVSLTEQSATALLDPLLTRYVQSTMPYGQMDLENAIVQLAPKLTPTSARVAFDALAKFTTEHGADNLIAPGSGLPLAALALRLTPDQAYAEFEMLVKRIHAVPAAEMRVAFALAQPMPALAGKLSDAQAPAAASALLKIVAEQPIAEDAYVLLPLMRGLGALSEKMTGAQLEASMGRLKTQFARAGDEQQAAGWAEVAVALMRPLPADAWPTTVLELLKYPTATGAPTFVLLTALHQRFADAPDPMDGPRPFVAWLATKVGREAVARHPTKP